MEWQEQPVDSLDKPIVKTGEIGTILSVPPPTVTNNTGKQWNAYKEGKSSTPHQENLTTKNTINSPIGDMIHDIQLS